MTRYLALACALLLSACASEPDPTLVELKLVAGKKLNPDQNQRPSPMVVRLIELNESFTFENADFFDLYHNDKNTLGPDFVASEDLVIRPGQVKEFKLRMRDTSKYLGLIGAYQNIDKAKWHYLITLDPEDTTRIEIGVAKDRLVKRVRSRLTGKYRHEEAAEE